MKTIKFKGESVTLGGRLPMLNERSPDFLLTKSDLSDVMLGDFAGRRVLMNIFPSVDTSVCACSVKRFDAEAAKLENTDVLCVSRDLPFAQERFRSENELASVTFLSELRDLDFGEGFGIRMTSGPLKGLLARTVVILDQIGQIAYLQLCPEITEEPDYDAALKALSAV